MKSIFVLVLFVYASNAYPCSLATMTERFTLNSELETTTPLKPSFRVSMLSRGVKSGTSCSGLASLRLMPQKLPIQEQGYIFEVVKGKYRIFHEEGPIRTTKTHRLLAEKFKKMDVNEFIFFFFEKTNKPIDVILKITAVSKSGEKSKPQLLKIQHEGVKDEAISLSIL